MANQELAFEKMYQGLTNQPPWRTQPGQWEDDCNIRLSIQDGATTRSGTDLLRVLTEMYNPIDPLEVDETYITSFHGDLIIFFSGGIYIFDADTMVQKQVIDNTGGFPYLTFSSRKDIRTTSFRKSLVVLNRTITTAVGNSANYTITDTVDRYSDLPDSATAGQYYRTKYTDGAVPKGYWLREVVDSELTWSLVAAPNQPNALPTGSTLPHELLRLDDGTYDWDVIDWTPRKSGNNLTNPKMPWFGETLKEVKFHYGRLFLISSGLITSTSTRDRYSLYQYDVDVEKDVSNPIIHDFSTSDAGDPVFANTNGGDLLIVCQKKVVAFSAGQEQLTNVNGNDRPIESVMVDDTIFPAADGNTFIFVDKTRVIHKYTYDAKSLVSLPTGDIGSHVLNILRGESGQSGTADVIPYNLFSIDGTLFITTNGWMRVYEERIDGGEYVQQGWSKYDFNWQYDTSNQVFYMDQWDDTIRILVRNSMRGFAVLTYTHRRESPPANFEVAPDLDFRQYMTGTYLQGTNHTRFMYPNATVRTRVFTPGTVNTTITPVLITATYIEVKGKITGTCCIGQMYYSYVDFSKLYAGVSTVIPIVSTMTVFQKDTSDYDILIRRRGNDIDLDHQSEFTYRSQHIGSFAPGDNAVKTEYHTFPVMQNGQDMFLRIEHQSPYPMTISAVKFSIAGRKGGGR
jgi:hypothetical protein